VLDTEEDVKEKSEAIYSSQKQGSKKKYSSVGVERSF
jgi:hypothetical protein